MDNVVSINNTKENTLELDVSVQGLDTEDIRVWFGVRANGMDISFDCKREGEGDKWTCVVPPLPFLERTAYPCSVCIVADGYYFEPLSGTLNVVGSAEVYSTAPKNITIKPAGEKKDKKDDKKEIKVTTEAQRSKPSPHTRQSEKSIAQIAQELMEQANLDPANIDKKVAAKKAEAAKKIDESDVPKKEKNAAVMAILEDLGVRQPGKKKTPRVSFIKKD